MAHLSNFDRIRSTNTFVSGIVWFSLVGRSSILLQLQSFAKLLCGGDSKGRIFCRSGDRVFCIQSLSLRLSWTLVVKKF